MYPGFSDVFAHAYMHKYALSARSQYCHRKELERANKNVRYIITPLELQTHDNRSIHLTQ